MNEIRQDPCHPSRHVIFSPGRAARPERTEKSEAAAPDDCPFCRGNEDMTPPTIATDADDWTFRLIENKFPAVSDDAPEPRSDALLPAVAAQGRHEILVEGSDHRRFSELDADTMAAGLHMLQERVAELAARDGVEHVTVFKNSGGDAGASIAHPHTQLIAAPVVPAEVAAREERARTYSAENDSCLYTDLAERAREDGRVVLERDGITAYCPYASEWPYQVRIVPGEHFHGFADLDTETVDALAAAIHTLVTRYRDVFGDRPYNLLHYSFPEHGHFHLDLFPRDKTLAGAELEGLPINEVLPARAAEVLR